MRSRRTTAGFTFLETTLVLAVTFLLVGSFARAFTTSSGLAKQSRVVLRADEELRRNLDAVGNCLRGAALASLTGFDGSGNSTTPSWKCVTGADASGGPVYDATQSMQWAASTAADATPGKLTVTKSGVTTTLVRHIPSGGFTANLSGTTLKVTLSTIYTTSQGFTKTVSGSISVSLRN